MLNGLITQIQQPVKAINGKKEDIFISCASFEKRCRGVIERLDPEYKVTTSFIFRYEAENMTNLRDINYHNMVEAIAEHTDSTNLVMCDHRDPLSGIGVFQKLLREKDINLNEKVISLDMTTFTKQYLLVLLKLIEKQKPKQIRIFYAEPEAYADKWSKPLSYGLVDVVSVPTYGGHTYIEKENLLVLLLGYEGDRAYSIWERLSPHKTIIMIGKPSYNESWEGRVEEFNKKLIDKLPSNAVRYAPSLDPFSVCSNLNALFDDYQEEYNIALSPLGPKPQVLGAYLSLSTHEDVQVLYSIPKYYEEKYFSKDIGKIWEYR